MQKGTLSSACKGLATNGSPACPLLPHSQGPRTLRKGTEKQAKALKPYTDHACTCQGDTDSDLELTA